MESFSNLRITLLLKKANLYWHPILAELSKIYPQTQVYTGFDPGFSWDYQDAFKIKQIGKIKFLGAYKDNKKPGYEPGLIYLSPRVIFPLLKSKPEIIFTDGFCIWTVLVLLLKAFTRWRVIIILEGSTPGVDYRNSWLRIKLRRLMASLTDSFITNNERGKIYLEEVLRVESKKIFAKPYLVPDKRSLQQCCDNTPLASLNLNLNHPVFFYVGQIIPRKGIEQLLTACHLLRQDNADFSLLIAGNGWQRQDLEAMAAKYNLSSQIKWLDLIDYGNLGIYYQFIDVFVLPTFEDTWGMVVLEAMNFGKPILCSKLAGASELIVKGKNGYCFDPYDAQKLAMLMHFFIDNPQIIKVMGQQSIQLIQQHSPEKAARSLTKAISWVTGIK